MPTERASSDVETLHALLAKQASEAAAAALQTGGSVPAERLDELGRLARLVELYDAAVPSPGRRWAVGLVALITLACVSVLMFARVSGTEIDVDLKVSELSFVVPSLQAVTDPMNVSRLRISGLKAVELPGARAGPATMVEARDMLVAADQANRRTGTISVNPITVAAGSRVRLRKSADNRSYWLSVRRVAPELAASLEGPVRIVVPPSVNVREEFGFPHRIGFRPDSQEVSLEFVAADTIKRGQQLRSPLPAESLFLFRIDQFNEGAQSLIRQVPTIQSGTLYFESIDGHAVPLRAGEGLHLSWSRGEIRELQFGADGISLRFHGSVRGMRAGSGEVTRSLMPTVFEWLRARHSLSLLWGTTAYAVSLFITIGGWWRRPT